MAEVIRRCAIYTRKSSEEGLEQDFNSLHAQREACEAYIRSQRGEGWRLIPGHYDDGGISGGTMERPALKRLLADIQAGKVDVVVVYKVDRLTRSLADFAKMVEVFDAKGVSFVAVTQQFNTTTSMGRLTLNVLLSFAQFEREVTGERIRDKIAASKKKGMWMGGVLPLGYSVSDRKLQVIPQEAETVRYIFDKYLVVGGVRELAVGLRDAGIRSRKGYYFARGMLYGMLSNPLYVGDIHHKGQHYPGQHEPIVDRNTWEAVQEKLKSQAKYYGFSRKTGTSQLTGKLFDVHGNPLSPSHAKKPGKRYRYYVSRCRDDHGRQAAWRLPAWEIEGRTADIVLAALNDQASLMQAGMEQGLDAQALDALQQSARLRVGENPLDLVERVYVDSSRMTVTMKLPGPPAIKVERSARFEMRRRGHQKRLVIPAPGQSEPRQDARLIRAMGHGLKFWEEMLRNPALTGLDIARREKLDPRYVTRALPLAFLAPDAIETFVAGRQLPEWTAERLLRLSRLPGDWERQSHMFSGNDSQ